MPDPGGPLRRLRSRPTPRSVGPVRGGLRGREEGAGSREPWRNRIAAENVKVRRLQAWPGSERFRRRLGSAWRRGREFDSRPASAKRRGRRTASVLLRRSSERTTCATPSKCKAMSVVCGADPGAELRVVSPEVYVAGAPVFDAPASTVESRYGRPRARRRAR